MAAGFERSFGICHQEGLELNGISWCKLTILIYCMKV